jgi:hypothetical protein
MGRVVRTTRASRGVDRDGRLGGHELREELHGARCDRGDSVCGVSAMCTFGALPLPSPRPHLTLNVFRSLRVFVLTCRRVLGSLTMRFPVSNLERGVSSETRMEMNDER